LKPNKGGRFGLAAGVGSIPKPFQRKCVWVVGILTAIIFAATSGDCMILLIKKVGGLVFVLLGGLTIAHAASTGRTWETVLGLLLVIIGVGLLAMKIVHRNIASANPPSESSGTRR
jgi:uncharacterized membrane protein